MSLFLQAASTEIPYSLGATIGGALVLALGTVFKLWLSERAETARATAAILAERDRALASQAPLVEVVGKMAASLTEVATQLRELRGDLRGEKPAVKP